MRRRALIAATLAVLAIAAPASADHRHTQYGAHEEGRAVDWRLSYADELDRAEAGRLIHKLLRHDARIARRMGIQAIIWHCRWWGANPEAPELGWHTLGTCERGGWEATDPGYRHDNHVHLELNWSGALTESTFWSLPRRRWSAKNLDSYRFDDAHRCTHLLQPGAASLVWWLALHFPRGEFLSADYNPPPGERCLPAGAAS